MKTLFAVCGAFLLASRVIAAPADPPLATSKQPHSSVSVLVGPQLNDGRLVLKVAAQNNGAAPVPFGPASISINKAAGEAISLSSLQQLTNDILAAAGMKLEVGSGEASLPGGYSAPQMQVDSSGHPDVSNYTAGAAVGADEYVRRSAGAPRKSKPSIDRQTAETQIAALKQAILQDTMLQPGQVVAGQVVSHKLNFKKGEDRTINVRVRVAGDEHGFTLLAPAN